MRAQQPTFVSAEFVKHFCGAAATDDNFSQGGLYEALLHCVVKHTQQTIIIAAHIQDCNWLLDEPQLSPGNDF